MKLNLHSILLLILTSLSQISCVNSAPLDTLNELNDQMENGNDQLKENIDKSYDLFNSSINDLESSKGRSKELEKIIQIQEQALAIKAKSKSLTNFFVLKSSELIKFSKDESFGIKKEGDIPGPNHFDVDEDGYYHLYPLNHLTKKDDYEAATKLFIGNNPNHPKGQFLVDSIIKYRNQLCMLIANYKDENGHVWKFTPSEIKFENEKDPTSLEKFKKGIENSLITVNPKDTALIKQLFLILTPPEKTISQGEEKLWLANTFDHAPLVAVIAMFTAIRSDILQAENKAVTHIASKITPSNSDFNQKEPMPSSSKTSPK